jgi:chromatin segregation and condensation protein Rec8/ScpA/Scc1 (kleisin family)
MVYTIDEKEMDRWRVAVAPITDQWIKTMADRGLPGQAAVDLMKKVLKERHGM